MSPSKTGKDVSMRRCDQIGPAEVMRGILAWLVEGLGGAEALSRLPSATETADSTPCRLSVSVNPQVIREAFMKNISAAVLSVFLILTMAGCARQSALQKAQAVNNALAQGGGFLRDAFYACLLNGYYQGLSLSQIKKDCETKLLNPNKGIDLGPFGDVTGAGSKPFDPARAVTANCAAGDPRRAAGASNIPGYGEYSWGKPKGQEAWKKGLDEGESRRRKEEAIEKAKEEDKKFWELEKKAQEAGKKAEEAKKTGDQAQIDRANAEEKKAEDAAVEQAKKALDAAENASKDPNDADGYVRTSQDVSPCQEALQYAREFLWECQRTNWKSYECQALQAKMNRCPDPAQIYVDPEQGYSCGIKFDAEALKNAWVARCEELKRPGPEGNPCEPPKVDDAGHYIEGKLRDICKDPAAYVDPESEQCSTPLVIKPFGRPDVQQLMVWGLNKLGGPVVVLPPRGDTTPPSPPGPAPRPN